MSLRLRTPLLTLAVSMTFLGLTLPATASVFNNTSEIKAPPVLVSAGVTEKDLLDMGLSVSVVTAKEIENSSAMVVGDLLKTVPGVEIVNTGSQGLLRVCIRGEFSNQTMVMIDGQKVIDQASMDGIPLTIDPSNIERIEVIKGPASVLYGTDGIGGVINIVTKKADKKRKFAALVSAGYNTGNKGYTSSGTIGGTVGKFNYHLNASKVHAKGIETKVGRMTGTHFDTQSANAHLGYKLTDKLSVGVGLEYFDMEFGSAYWNQMDEKSHFSVWIPIMDRKKAAVFINWDHPMDKLKRVRFDAFYQKLHKRMWSAIEIEPDPFCDPDFEECEAFDPMDIHNHHDQYGATLQTDWQINDSLSLIAGYVFNFEKLLGNKPGHYKYLKGDFFNHAFYASADWWLTDKLELNYGGRLNHDSVKVKSGDRSQSSSTHWINQASILWHATPALVYRATWSQGLQTPRMMRVQDSLKYNTNLDPITSDNFEVGVRYKTESWNVDSAIYHTTTDFLDHRAKVIGLESSVSYKFVSTGLEPYMKFNWQYRRYGKKGALEKELLFPQATGTYGLRWSKTLAGIKWHTDVWGYSRTHDDVDTGWTIYNAKAGMDFGPKNRYTLNIGIENIGDKLYKRGNSAIYQAGRHATVKFNAKF